MFPALRKLDRAVYRAERVLCVALFGLASLVMFVYVVLGIYLQHEGVLRALSKFGLKPEDVSATTSLIINIGIVYVLAWIALLTVRRDPPFSAGRALVGALLITGAGVGLVKLLIILLPSNIIWAPRAGLACMLWIGLLGASTATYEKRHLALEVGEKVWPKKLRKKVKALALLTAAALCLFLAWMAAKSLLLQYDGWVRNPDAEGTNLSSEVQIPKWFLVGVIPYTLVVMAIRFLGQAAASFVADPDAEEQQEPAS